MFQPGQVGAGALTLRAAPRGTAALHTAPQLTRHSAGIRRRYSPHLRGDCKDQWQPVGTARTVVTSGVCEEEYLHEVEL